MSILTDCMYFMTKISPQTQVSIAYFCCSVSREGEKLIYTKAVTRVSFLVWKVVWGPHMSTAGPGHSAARGQGGKTPWSSGFIWNCKGILAMKMIVVHVIKVVVSVVKMKIQCMVFMALKRRKSCSGHVFNEKSKSK